MCKEEEEEEERGKILNKYLSVLPAKPDPVINNNATYLSLNFWLLGHQMVRVTQNSHYQISKTKLMVC